MGRSVGNIVIKNDPVKKPEIFILNLPHISSRGYADAKYEGYKPVQRAEGGYWLASFRIYGRENVLKEMFEKGLGRHVEVWGHGLEPDFEGLVEGLELFIAPDKFSKSLRTVSNKALMRADYDDDGVVERSSTIQNAASQEIYGVRDGVISGGQLDSLGVADQAVQAFVDLKSWPMPSAKLGKGGTTTGMYLDVKVTGYITTLQNRVYNQTTDTGVQALNSQVIDIIGTYLETYTLKNGLVGWWPLDEASDGTGAVTRTDKHAGLNLTDNDNVPSGAGKLYNGADFESTATEYLSRTSEAALQPGTDLTVACWFKPESVASGQDIVSKWAASGQYQHILIVDSAGPNFEWWVSSNGTDSYHVDHTTTIVNDTWYFVVCWHDSTNDLLNIQVNNGTPVTLAHSAGIYASGTDPFCIGFRSGGTTYADGIVDEVAMWNRVLTANERSILYNAGAGWGYHQIGTPWLSTGVGEFIRSVETRTNVTKVTKEYDVDRRAFDIVMDIPKLGDLASNRWIIYGTGRNCTGVHGRKIVLDQASPITPPATV